MQQLLLLLRDIIKEIYRGYIQLKTRLVIERHSKTWVHINARLDVLPQNPTHKRHTLLLKKGAFIEAGCVVNTWHGEVIFGNRSHIGINTIVIGPITIGNHVKIAQNCFLTGENHRFDDIKKSIGEQGFFVKPIIIRDYVWIGANCTILPGVEIGEHSVVGAGSVVTRNVPSYSVVVGNPARCVKKYDQTDGSWKKLSA